MSSTGNLRCTSYGRSTYQVLTQDERKHEKYKEEHCLLMQLLHQRLGPHTIVGDLADLGKEDMPQYDPYKDESQNVETLTILDEESGVIPEQNPNI